MVDACVHLERREQWTGEHRFQKGHPLMLPTLHLVREETCGLSIARHLLQGT